MKKMLALAAVVYSPVGLGLATMGVAKLGLILAGLGFFIPAVITGVLLILAGLFVFNSNLPVSTILA